MEKKRTKNKKKPICVGSGFVALDLVLIGNKQQNPDFRFAGGSCGNVLTILAYFGWEAVPVLRLKNDIEAAQLVADLKKWSVNTRFVLKEASGITPVVVQRICTSINGDSYHRFEWKSPTTGISLPRYRPLPQRIALQVSTKLPKPSVFYFDRVAKSALLLAKQAKENGALVFFEPSSVGDVALFKECVAISDVFKYSIDRIDNPPRESIQTDPGPRLEVQTLGNKGLRYKLSSKGRKKPAWKALSAFKISNVKDAAGAGDWCSAGIIKILGERGRPTFIRAAESKILKGLRIGQAMAAINCGYEGARGGMYKLQKSKLEKLALEMVDDRRQTH